MAGQVYRAGRRRASRERVGGREWGGRSWSQSRALAPIAGARGGGATGSAIRTCWRAAAWRPGRVSPHAGSGRRPAVAAGAAATTPADAPTRASLPASACSSTATVAAQRLGGRVRMMGRALRVCRNEHPAGERSRFCGQKNAWVGVAASPAKSWRHIKYSTHPQQLLQAGSYM